MKTLLLALPLMMIAISCNRNNRDAGAEFQKEKQEVNKEYRESVNEAKKERREDMESAREDLREQEKEEATEYVEESDRATIDREEQKVDIQESQDQ
jgi:predicted solute-binding protein